MTLMSDELQQRLLHAWRLAMLGAVADW